MSQIAFSPATGQLLLTREQLVALAQEVGADRVRGLDGVGLVHVGVDGDEARESLVARGLGPEYASFLGSEAFWVRRVLGALRVAEPGDRAVLVVRHEADRVVSHLAGLHGSTAVVVKAVYDEPVTFGPISTVACPAYLVKEIDPDEMAAGVWSSAFVPVDTDGGGGGGGALVRVAIWWRDEDGEHETTMSWTA